MGKTQFRGLCLLPEPGIKWPIKIWSKKGGHFILRQSLLRIWNPLYTLLTNPFTRPSLPAQLFVCNGFSYSYLSPATNLKSAHQPIARWLTHKPFEVGIMCKISFPARLPILTRKEVERTYSPKYIRPIRLTSPIKVNWYFVVFCTCYWRQIRNGRVFEQTSFSKSNRKAKKIKITIYLVYKVRTIRLCTNHWPTMYPF